MNFVSNRGPERVRSFANTIIEVGLIMTESSVYLMVQVKCGGEKSQLSQVRYFEMKISTFTSIFGISLFSCR